MEDITPHIRQGLHGLIQGNIGAGNGRRPGAAIGLKHITVHNQSPFAQ
jgi:hypothetical protein